MDNKIDLVVVDSEFKELMVDEVIELRERVVKLEEIVRRSLERERLRDGAADAEG